MTVEDRPVGATAAPRQVFCDFMSSFVTGVAVVTATDGTGRPRGLTCSSLTSVTVHPPTLLVSLDQRAGTLAAVRTRGAFAVHLLRHRARAVAELFASSSHDRFAQVPWCPSPELGLPWLYSAAFGLAECRSVRIEDVGDHAVVIGEVVRVTPEASGGRPDPLLYGHRRFHRLDGGPARARPAAVPR